ncbi:cytochrome P450 [Nocardia otitidiscaviarum]|uniref:cytochrome P450 n=1 Tax=Nocardia otitidiscaviarum TaxID=1823 RepID=UPI000694DE04|nr:cytochrome P450 [Nocardia otitidiscaviarum]MBF6135558.1 cytochrome P450 [Nocardia otitidiscaviarum]MBF6487375.1 cytochrome P450 [Nocardia otitidiscaviarum]
MRLYSSEFAADPGAAYQDLRYRYGALAPAEVAPGVPVTLVTGYRAALDVLTDPSRFPADPRQWQQRVTGDCPALPMLQWRPDAMRSAGNDHARYRRAVTDCLDRVDPFALSMTVEHAAARLIDGFCESGSADLLSRFAIPLTVQAFNRILGLAPAAAQAAFDALALMREATDAAAVDHGDRMLLAAMRDTVSAKHAAPAGDVASWLLNHPAGLDDTEVTYQLVMLYVTGCEPTWNLIANTLLLLMTDDRFGEELLAGALTARDAIDEVLFADPPLANACPRFPRQMQIIGEAILPEHQPVLVSLAAGNSDPAVGGDRTGNRSHLAWGAGPHQCPARSLAMVIVQEALDQLLDALPDIELAVPLEEVHWRASAFHRAPAAVPTRFPPSPPLSYVHTSPSLPHL